jgi:hypothetical protein
MHVMGYDEESAHGKGDKLGLDANRYIVAGRSDVAWNNVYDFNIDIRPSHKQLVRGCT